MQTAKPVLVARFILDPDGSPQIAHKGKAPHYRMTLSVLNAPQDAYAVTYELHESYYDPVRESRKKNNGFPEEITSYGDYEVRAMLRSKTRNQALVAELSEALRRGHAQELSSSALQKAIRDIRDH